MIYLVNLFCFLSVACLDCFGIKNSGFGEDRNKVDFVKYDPWGLQATNEVKDKYIDTSMDSSYSDEDVSYHNAEKDKNEETKWYDVPEHRVRIKYMKQPINHFNPHHLIKWNMKCLQNTAFWTPNSPIYLFIGGNEPVSDNFVKEGLMFELAKDTGGVMFAAEHRFYGVNETNYDLDFLHSHQALADLDALLGNIKAEPEYSNSKVAVIGGGYGGNLAVWLKVLYPDSVDVVVASSAPLLAKVNYEEYLQQVSQDFKEFIDPECIQFVVNHLIELAKCNKTNKRDCLYINQPICADTNVQQCPTRSKTLKLYFLSLFNIFMDSAEIGLNHMKNTCKKLRAKEYFYMPAPLFWNEEKKCNDFDYDRFIEKIQNGNSKVKHWLYQCCNEFGYFKVGTVFFDIDIEILLPLNFYVSICSDLFGAEFDENTIDSSVKRTNMLYGGKTPKVDNVIFTHGELDPWKHLGVLKPFSKDVDVIVIPKVSHCKDLQPSKESDSDVLKNARSHIKEFVKSIVHSASSSTEEGTL